MKRNKYQLILFSLLAIVILIAMIMIVKVTAQDQNTKDLAFRLGQLGIPVVEY